MLRAFFIEELGDTTFLSLFSLPKVKLSTLLSRLGLIIWKSKSPNLEEDFQKDVKNYN